MQKILLIATMFALSACQSNRVDSLRVESQFGNPIRGATVGMSSMNSGYPIYPDVTSGEGGIAPLQNKITIGPSFVFSVTFEDRRYILEYSDVKWDGGVPVLRLKGQY